METLLSRTTSDAREARRYRAYELHQKGWTQTAIAEALGVTQGAVSQWLGRAKKQGIEALQARPIPGVPRRLPREELAKLPGLLEKGAEAFGFRGNVWTQGRVAVVLHQELGVRYSRRHISRLLQEIGWSRKKPEREARQRNEAKRLDFREVRWPAIKKS